MLFSVPVGDVSGRSGTGDLSTEVETDVPASKMRAVVTRRLILLAGDGGRRPRSGVPVVEHSRELLEQAFDNGVSVFQTCILLVLFLLVPRLHDCLVSTNSVLILPILSSAQLNTSLLRFARLCVRKKKHMPWSRWWKVGSLICLFRGLLLTRVSLYFSCLENLTTYRTGFNMGSLNLHALLEKQQISMEMKASSASEGKGSFQKRYINWRKLGRTMNLRDCLWLVRQIPWRSPVIFIVNSVGVMCLCWPTGHLTFWGTIRVQNISL